jgi:hypothetical protein
VALCMVCSRTSRVSTHVVLFGWAPLKTGCFALLLLLLLSTGRMFLASSKRSGSF